ncbi:hypothetical protein HYC85_023612 [Camellia sinensis]|uniref:GHMP kinase N-terminal domain-containing protein n=1 Tax=Camellia sinensis TaxID=4442 RepID=A0A7J7GF17_CAMSI|nr:hypothetical protein HYC85_023612 [Camellia sinensis]
MREWLGTKYLLKLLEELEVSWKLLIWMKNYGELIVSRGDKGNLFILKMIDPSYRVPQCYVSRKIHLDKRVPTGVGLGGGSSNAATALWVANQFSGCLATEKELQEWSSEIGSDVPFFFFHGAACCTGRGCLDSRRLDMLIQATFMSCASTCIDAYVVQDIPPPISFDIPTVLIKPPQACSTAEVYKRLWLDQTSKIDPSALLEKISRNGISQDICVNDLEPPAFEVLPSLKRLKQRFVAASRGQYDAVFMSGSGSTIVGIGSPDPPQFVYDDDEYKDVEERTVPVEELLDGYEVFCTGTAVGIVPKLAANSSQRASSIYTYSGEASEEFDRDDNTLTLIKPSPMSSKDIRSPLEVGSVHGGNNGVSNAYCKVPNVSSVAYSLGSSLDIVGRQMPELFLFLENEPKRISFVAFRLEFELGGAIWNSQILHFRSSGEMHQTAARSVRAFGNLGLLAGYGAKPIGPGLGRDRVVSERYLTTSYTAHTCPNEL